MAPNAMLLDRPVGTRIQTWRAAAIDAATRPGKNPSLRAFITQQNLVRKGAPDNPQTLAEMTRFNTLHHIVSKEKLTQVLAPAMVKGYNHADEPTRKAARAFLESVQSAVGFHADILDPPGDQVGKFAALLRNIPLNFELGFEKPIANAGSDFDPQVVAGDSAYGITNYELDPLSKVLSELDRRLDTLAANPSSDDWEQLKDILDRALELYNKRPRLGEHLMRPSLEQWDTYKEEAQRKRPGRNVEDVATAFAAAGNPYATSQEKADLDSFEEDFEFDSGDLDETSKADFGNGPETYRFVGIRYRVKLRHIAGRHTMRFFQFKPQAINSFFPGIQNADQLKQKVRQVLGAVVTQRLRQHIQNLDISSGDWPDLSLQEVCDGFYVDFATTTEDADGRERVVVSVATLAPESNAIFVTKPKLDAFLQTKTS